MRTGKKQDRPVEVESFGRVDDEHVGEMQDWLRMTRDEEGDGDGAISLDVHVRAVR